MYYSISGTETKAWWEDMWDKAFGSGEPDPGATPVELEDPPPGPVLDPATAEKLKEEQAKKLRTEQFAMIGAFLLAGYFILKRGK